MFIKKGDMVEVITGADKGKSGKVVLALPSEDKIIVENINRHKHHQRPKRANQKGQVVEKAMPIHVSNVRLAKK